MKIGYVQMFVPGEMGVRAFMVGILTVVSV